MNTLVSFQVAKLLKEKKFDKPTNLLYQLNGTLHTVIPNSDYPHLKVHNNKEIDSYTNGFLNWNGLDLDEDESLDLYSGFNEKYDDAFSVCCTAPTIADVIMWLYEKHGIWIIAPTHDNNDNYFCYEINFKPSHFLLKVAKNKWSPKEIRFNSPTEAYEAAIEYTLNNLV